MITQDYLKEILDYDPSIGLLIWRYRNDVPKEWNTKWAGKPAGRIQHKGYFDLVINYKYYLTHRIVWLYMTGEWPNKDIDHKDGDGTNNKWDNLRLATSQENNRNRKPNTKPTASGYKGITKFRNKWRARIRIDGKELVIGYFDTKELAYSVYCEEVKKYFGEFARVA